MSPEKRDRGVLTHDDRQYLLGEKDLSKGSEYNARTRIRQRVRDAILDFEVLFDELDSHDREKIFGPRKDEEGEFELPSGERIKSHNGMYPPMGWALVDVMAFLYSATEGSNVRFEHLVEAGVWEAHPKLHPKRRLNNVEMNIDSLPRERVLERALERLEQEKTLSAPHVAILMEADEVTDEQILKARKLMQTKERKHWLSREQSYLKESDTE